MPILILRAVSLWLFLSFRHLPQLHYWQLRKYPFFGLEIEHNPSARHLNFQCWKPSCLFYCNPVQNFSLWPVYSAMKGLYWDLFKRELKEFWHFICCDTTYRCVTCIPLQMHFFRFEHQKFWSVYTQKLYMSYPKDLVT